MRRFRLIVLYLLIIIAGSNKTYSQDSIDSLLLELTKTNNDTNKVDLLNKITWLFRINAPQKGIVYNRQAFSLAREIKYTYGIARAYDLLGTIYFYQSNDLNALDNYIKAMELYKELNDSIKMAQVYNSIGQLYQSNKNHLKSLNSYFKAYEIYKAANDSAGIAIISNNIGIIYSQNNQDSLALDYYKQAFEMNKKINRKRGVGYASMNIGNIYLKKGLYNKAKDYYRISFNNFEKEDDPKGFSISNFNLGNSYVYLAKFDSAALYLLKSKEIATKYSFLNEIKTSLGGLKILYKKQNEYAKAYLCQEEYIKIQDTLLQIRTAKTMKELERKIEFEEEIKEQEFELLEKSKKLKINTLQKYLLLIVLLSVSIISISLINRKRTKIRFYNNELAIKNNELVNLAIYILQKNDLVHSFRKQLLQLQRRLKVEENKKSVDEILNSLIFKIAISKDIEKFRDKLREISNEFYEKLELKTPGLTEKEKQLATLLRLNFTSKQIAIILNITSESVDINRYRLRKKIALNQGEKLSVFFSSI